MMEKQLYAALMLVVLAFGCLCCCSDKENVSESNAETATTVGTSFTEITRGGENAKTTITAETSGQLTKAQKTTTATTEKSAATTTSAATTKKQFVTTMANDEIMTLTQKVERAFEQFNAAYNEKNLEKCLKDVYTLDGLHVALSAYFNENQPTVGMNEINNIEIWSLQLCLCAADWYWCFVEDLQGNICLADGSDLAAETISIDGVDYSIQDAESKFGYSVRYFFFYPS